VDYCTERCRSDARFLTQAHLTRHRDPPHCPSAACSSTPSLLPPHLARRPTCSLSQPGSQKQQGPFRCKPVRGANGNPAFGLFQSAQKTRVGTHRRCVVRHHGRSTRIECECRRRQATWEREYTETAGSMVRVPLLKEVARREESIQVSTHVSTRGGDSWAGHLSLRACLMGWRGSKKPS
jgi:hypothetical protein